MPYIVGVIKTTRPDILISPTAVDTVEELFAWLTTFFNNEEFILSGPISMDALKLGLGGENPMTIPMNGLPLAILFGESDVIMRATSRFLNIVDLNLLDKNSYKKVIARLENLN